MTLYQTARTFSWQRQTEAIDWEGPGYYIYKIETLQWERAVTLSQVEKVAAKRLEWIKYFKQDDVEEMAANNGR